MMRIQPVAAILLCGVLTAPGFGQVSEITGTPEVGFFSRLTQNYRPRPVRTTNFTDSGRA